MKPQLAARLSKALKTEESESISAKSANADKADEPETIDADAHESGSNDSMDIDMADIVIIDEYDSTKNDTKNESSSKRVRFQSLF